MRVALFTPGPSNTSESVKKALKCDIGTRTQPMAVLTQRLREQIAEVAECGSDFEVVPIQGSGTFAVEAMLTSLLPSDAHCLVIVNGPYGERMAEIYQIYALKHQVLRLDPLRPIDANVVAKFLDHHPDITALALVQFETGIGLNNPLAAILADAEHRQLLVLVDGMSAFGLLPIDFNSQALLAVAASSNKILHGIPGVGFVLARSDALQQPSLKRSLSLDLIKQYQEFQRSGMWRFTPPVQIIAALSVAIEEYQDEGGRLGRWHRYQKIATIVIDGLAQWNITPLVNPADGAPVIVTFTLPFPCETLSAIVLSAKLFEHHIAIYPSQISEVNSFRIGFIGDLTCEDALHLVNCIGDIVCSLVPEYHHLEILRHD